MKLTKKLIPALGMLVLSACMLVTSTFAWFSMNEKVTAKGMTVTAKADQVFLQIVTTATGFDNTQAQTSADATNSGFEAGGEALTFLPITVGAGLTNTDKTLTPVTETDGLLSSADIKWYTNNSNDPGLSTAVDAYQSVSGDTALADYCLINTFYVRLNPATNKTATNNDLKCTIGSELPSSDPMAETVSVLVVCGDYAQLWKQTALNSWSATGTKLTTGGFENKGVDKDEGHEVKVYIFFNGEHGNCTTNNVKTTGYGINVYFSVAD